MATTNPTDHPVSVSGKIAAYTKSGYLLLILVLMGAIVCWVRNRDILSDLYDYSSMIAAAGKTEAGLKPYVDFRSTMQSACYVLPRWVELVAGRNYLGLTWGALALSLGGAIVLFGLLRRTFGSLLAAALAGAVTWAGFVQHVIIFYNPLGLLCLAVVVIGVADIRYIRVWHSPRAWLVIAALIVGGANKINFQALALGLAGLAVLRASVAGEISWRRVWSWWFGLLFFGLVLPISLELAWTGASLPEWYFNVVGLAEARVGALALVFSPHSYLAPTYAMHQHILIKPLHTIGLVVLAAVTVMAWRHIPTTVSTGKTGLRQIVALRAVLVLTAVTAGVGGILLTITNIESITLTSLAVLVGAALIAITFGIAGRKDTQCVLGGAALIWLVVGGYAAWAGSRVLYARATIDRATFVRLVDAPQSLKYLEGVRLDAGLYASLLLTARKLQALEAKRGDLSSVLFGPTLEWMERNHPESILRGMPVWYDVGTSLRQSDGAWLFQQMETKPIDHLFLHPGWESWPDDFRTWLNKNFRTEQLGPVVKVYERSVGPESGRASLTYVDSNPLTLLDHTGSLIHVRTTRVSAVHPVAFFPSQWGEFFGTVGGWTWSWERPVRSVSGTLIAVASTKPVRPLSLSWRIVADPDGKCDVLWSGKTNLTEAQPTIHHLFHVETIDRPLVFEIETDGADGIMAGWREMRILNAGNPPPEPVPPGLTIGTPARKYLLSDGTTAWLRASDDLPPNAAVSGLSVPFEAWTPAPDVSGPWWAELAITPSPTAGATPVVMLLWYKSGRLEILNQSTPPDPNGTFIFQGRMPESGGWLGIAVRPLEPGKPLNAKLSIVRWMK